MKVIERKNNIYFSLLFSFGNALVEKGSSEKVAAEKICDTGSVVHRNAAANLFERFNNDGFANRARKVNDEALLGTL